MFSTPRNKSSSLVLKPCKSVQEASEEVCSLKLDRYIYRGLIRNLNSYLTETVSIENYEIQISRSVFHAYPSYLCRFSFLTTLDIYKDYFKGHLTWCKGCCNCCCTIIVTRDKITLIHHFPCKGCCVFTPRVL